jgi:hypothetical protein
VGQGVEGLGLAWVGLVRTPSYSLVMIVSLQESRVYVGGDYYNDRFLYIVSYTITYCINDIYA